MTGRKGRVSILAMMAFVSIVAAQCGLLRFIWDTTLAMALMTLPLLNVMALGLPKLRSDAHSRCFWVGFEVVGMGLLGLCYAMLWYSQETALWPILWLYHKKWLMDDSPEHLAIACACVVAIYTPPQLLLASFAGWLSSRYQIVRRTFAVDRPAGHLGSGVMPGDGLRMAAD